MAEITTLDNGLRVINEHMSDLQSVSINVWVNTGSRNESKQNNGISHFLEHMAFKGTDTRGVKKIAEDFDNIGGRVNAFTSTTKTVYYTKVLDDRVERAVELLADITQHSIFPSEEIEKERTVILQELAMINDDPEDEIEEHFMETAYKNQPAGRRIIGTANNIKKFVRDDFVKYVTTQYKIKDIAISFAGNLQNTKAVQLVEKYFTSLQKGKHKDCQRAAYSGGYFVKNKKLEQMQVKIGFESCDYLSPDFYDAMTLGVIMGGGMSSRLFQEIREKRGLCYKIHANNASCLDTGIFEVTCAVSPEKASETIFAVIDELKKAAQKINEDECKRAITKLKSSILMNRESNILRAQKNASELFIRGEIMSVKEIIEHIESVTTKKLQSFMERILSASQPTVAFLGKTGQNIPDYDTIRKKILA